MSTFVIKIYPRIWDGETLGAEMGTMGTLEYWGYGEQRGDSRVGEWGAKCLWKSFFDLQFTAVWMPKQSLRLQLQATVKILVLSISGVYQ